MQGLACNRLYIGIHSTIPYKLSTNPTVLCCTQREKTREPTSGHHVYQTISETLISPESLQTGGGKVFLNDKLNSQTNAR